MITNFIYSTDFSLILKFHQEYCNHENSLMVQWLGLHAYTAKDPGLISSQGTKLPQTTHITKGEKKNIITYNIIFTDVI